jgi:hypothetical protein
MLQYNVAKGKNTPSAYNKVYGLIVKGIKRKNEFLVNK